MERIPQYALKDLCKKCALDVSDTIKRTANLVDHPMDKLKIYLMSTADGTITSYAILRGLGFSPEAAKAYIIHEINRCFGPTTDSMEKMFSNLKKESSAS